MQYGWTPDISSAQSITITGGNKHCRGSCQLRFSSRLVMKHPPTSKKVECHVWSYNAVMDCHRTSFFGKSKKLLKRFFAAKSWKTKWEWKSPLRGAWLIADGRGQELSIESFFTSMFCWEVKMSICHVHRAPYSLSSLASPLVSTNQRPVLRSRDQYWPIRGNNSLLQFPSPHPLRD